MIDPNETITADNPEHAERIKSVALDGVEFARGTVKEFNVKEGWVRFTDDPPMIENDEIVFHLRQGVVTYTEIE